MSGNDDTARRKRAPNLMQARGGREALTRVSAARGLADGGPALGRLASAISTVPGGNQVQKPAKRLRVKFPRGAAPRLRARDLSGTRPA